MSYDYAAKLPGIIAKIADVGRPITLLRLQRSSDLRGVANPRATPELETSTVGVFVDINSASRYGLYVETTVDGKTASQVCLVAPIAGVDMQRYDELVDGDKTWTIITALDLKPGDTSLLWGLAVAS